MKPGNLAKTLGVSRGTIFNWNHWYEDFLSAGPPDGEMRVYTDDDLRVLAFVKSLTDRGINREGIKLALQQKRDSGSPIPPLPPEMLSDDGTDPGTDLALRAASTELALKDKEISRLNGRIEELLKQLTDTQTRSDQERKQLNDTIEAERKRYEALVEKYMNMMGQILDNQMKKPPKGRDDE